MSRLSNISSSPTMRQFAQGAAQSMVQPVADFIAPGVEVPTSVGQYKVYTERNRFMLPKTERALGGPATQLRFDATDATYNCAPHALDFPVDNLEQLEAAGLENMLQEGATAIAEVASLAHEKTVLDAALTAAGSGTDSDFTSSSVDPVSLIDDAILNVLKAAKYGSLMSVGVLFGATAFKRFRNNANVRARFTVGGAGKGKQLVSPTVEDAGNLFIGNPDTRVSWMVYDAADQGQTASISFVLDAAVLIFARHPNPTRRDPSFMKTFRLAGNWMVPGSYVKEDGRGEVAKFDWSEHVVVTNSTAVARINGNAS